MGGSAFPKALRPRLTPGRGRIRKPGFGNWSQDSETHPNLPKLGKAGFGNQGSRKTINQASNTRIRKLAQGFGNSPESSETRQSGIRKLRFKGTGNQASETRVRKPGFGNQGSETLGGTSETLGGRGPAGPTHPKPAGPCSCGAVQLRGHANPK